MANPTFLDCLGVRQKDCEDHQARSSCGKPGQSQTQRAMLIRDSVSHYPENMEFMTELHEATLHAFSDLS